MSYGAKIQKRKRKHYAAGASFSIGMLWQEVTERQLSPQDTASLLACFAHVLDMMRSSYDTTAPFLTRAMASALNMASMEDYDSAYQRIIKRTEQQKKAKAAVT